MSKKKLIPKTVWLGGVPYKIKRVSLKTLRNMWGNPETIIYGTINYLKHIIYLNKDADDELAFKFLLHEVYHDFDNDYTIFPRRQRELKTQIAAREMATFLQRHYVLTLKPGL